MGINKTSISIHAPTRGATVLVEQELTLPKFQSTLPRGERPSGLSRISSALKFQSTLPRGERQTTGADRPEPINFNPRSHEGSDSDIGKKISDFRISIHAPTRGATLIVGRTWDEWLISIHAPTRGATVCFYIFQLIEGDFNPRSHEGSDGLCRTRKVKVEISIHAPTRGATPCLKKGYCL